MEGTSKVGRTTITIAPGQFCLMNVFTVRPENQQALLDRLHIMTIRDVVNAPGFISATFHLSHDGTQIVNYAQWRSEKDWQAMLAQNPDHVKHCEELAECVSPLPLTVLFCTHAQHVSPDSSTEGLPLTQGKNA